MTIYEEFIERVYEGESFSIDFEKRIMKVGKTKLIDDGGYDNTRQLIDFKGFVFEKIEALYQDYKYSLPSERSDNKRRKYFKALSIDEIPDDKLMMTHRREIAQCKLEGFILCMILMNIFTWDEFKMGKWFWQSKKDPDLVILRSWIENK